MDLNLKIYELNLIIEQKDKQINELKGQTGGQEKFMNMVVHDMRNPSEAISNGLKQAKEIMKADIQKLMSELRVAFQKNRRQAGLNAQQNNVLQRNSSLQPYVEAKDFGTNYKSLKKTKSSFKNLLFEQKFNSIKSPGVINNNIIEPKNQNDFLRLQNRINKSNANDSSYKSVLSLKENLNSEQESISMLNIKGQPQSGNHTPKNEIVRIKSNRFQMNNQIEEEKVYIDPNESLNQPLIDRPIIQNQKQDNSIQSSNQQIQSNPRDNQLILSFNCNRQFDFNFQENQHINQNLQSEGQDVVFTLNQLSIFHQNYYKQEKDNERVIVVEGNRQSNGGSSYQQNSSMYDFSSDEIQENQICQRSRNNKVFKQNEQQKGFQQNIKESNLIVNQPRSFQNHENSKYLKRNKLQNLRSNLRGESQNIERNMNLIGREVIIFKEDLILKIDRTVQTGVDSSQSQNQAQIFFKIMQELQNLFSNKNLNDFLAVYSDYCDLMGKLQKAYKQQIEPSEIVNLFIQLLDQKQSQRYLPISKSSQFFGKQSNKNINQYIMESNLEIIEASQSISASSNMNEKSQSNVHIEALKRVQNSSMIKVSNQNKMRRFMISNINKDILKNSSDMSQYVKEYEQINCKRDNESEHNVIQKRSQKKVNLQSQKSLQRFNNQNKDQSECEDIKLMIKVLEKLKQALKINKTIEFYIQNSISSANIIANLTEDLLTLAKIKNNVFDLNLQPRVNLLNIVNDAYQVLSFNAASKKIGLLLEFDDKKTFILQNVTVDKRRILQILLNFLSNSVKFTNEDGYIKVSFKILEEMVMQSSLPMDDSNDNQISDQIMSDEDEQKKNILLEIAIQDTGAGISKENIDKLFTDFAKLNEHKQMNEKGTGLGLSICKQIIESMGGKVTVISQVGVGTKFIITINIDAQDEIAQNINRYSQQSIQSERQIFSEIFQNNFEIDLAHKNNHETQLDQIEQNPRQKQKSTKVYKFDSSQNAVAPQENDKNLKFVNKMINSFKQKMKTQENKEPSNSNSSILNEMSRLEISDSKSQYDIKDNLGNFNPVKRGSQYMGSLFEKNSSYRPQNLINNHEEKLEVKNDLIQFENMNQINYLSNEQNTVKSSIKDIYQELHKSQQKKEQSQLYINHSVIPVQNDNSLIKIEEMRESSSLLISINNDSNNHAESNMSSQKYSMKSSIEQNINPFENEKLQDYLNKNDILKQVIDISVKYQRHKLKFLVANDDSYSLFFIQTALSQMKTLSLLDSAENGQIALNLVQKNAPLVVDEDQIQQNYYDAIFLDLDMPIMNGNEACKQIQKYYYENKKMCYDTQVLHQNQYIIQLNDLQNIYADQARENLQKITPQWIKDLKIIYDKYIEISEKEEKFQNLEKNNINTNLLDKVIQTKEQILKVFNILYANQRYRALQIIQRPFIFAYSAFTNNKVHEETTKNGFDKLIDSPLNKLKVEEIIDKFIEPYALQLTKIMLQNLGPISQFDEILDVNKIINTKKISSGKMYQSVLQSIDLSPQSLVSREFKKNFLNDLKQMKRRSSDDLKDSESDDDSSVCQDEEFLIIKRQQNIKNSGLSMIEESEEAKEKYIFDNSNRVLNLSSNGD